MTHLQPTRSNALAARQALAQLRLSNVEVIVNGETSDEQSVDDDLRDLYMTRAVVEELAARQAVQHLSAADVKLLEEIAGSIEGAYRENRADDLAALSRELHFTIYRASKRRHLLRIIEELWDSTERLAAPEPHMLAENAEEDRHTVRSMVAACKLGDGNALGLMVRYRIHRAATHFSDRASAAASEAPRSRTFVRAEGSARRAK